MLPYRHYHASMSADEREAVQRDWSLGRVQVSYAHCVYAHHLLHC